MSFPLAGLLTLVVAAHAEPVWQSPYPEPMPLLANRFEGTFSQPPVPHYTVPLPGSGASRAERTRPVVVGASILVGSAVGEALYELDRGSGTVQRRYPASASVDAEPLVVGNRIFFGDTGGKVWSYELGKDEPVWTYDTAAPVLVRPALSDGRIFVSNVDDLTVALDAVDGTMLWRHKQRSIGRRRAELSLYAAPPPIVVGDTVYAGYHDGTLVALSAETGDPRWTLPVGEGRYPDLVAAPTPWENLLFASGYFEPLLAIDAATHKVVWSLPHGAADEAIVVQRSDGPLLLHPGTDGKLRGIRPRTGEVVWTWDSGDSAALVEPVPTPLGVIVGSTTGTLWAIDPDTGEATWRYSPAVVLEGLAAAPWVDGRQLVFATNGGRLYSLLSPSPERPWAAPAPATPPERRRPRRIR
jgi:outer membrane protein assembly factor BamB